MAVPFRICGEVEPVATWRMPWLTAAGSEKGSCTAAVEYVTLTSSV